MQYLKEQHNAYTLQTLSALNLNLKVISLFFWKIFLGLLGQRICAQFPYFSGLFIRWICMKIGSLFFKSSSVPTVHSSFRVIVQEQTQNSRRAALKWQTSVLMQMIQVMFLKSSVRLVLCKWLCLEYTFLYSLRFSKSTYFIKQIFRQDENVLANKCWDML